MFTGQNAFTSFLNTLLCLFIRMSHFLNRDVVPDCTLKNYELNINVNSTNNTHRGKQVHIQFCNREKLIKHIIQLKNAILHHIVKLFA